MGLSHVPTRLTLCPALTFQVADTQVTDECMDKLNQRWRALWGQLGYFLRMMCFPQVPEMQGIRRGPYVFGRGAISH